MSSNSGKIELVYSPYAWMKLWWLLQSADTEVGGWGIARNPEQLLYIDDIMIPKQKCTAAYCDFDMEDCAARFYDMAVDEKLDPKQFSAIWIHTHPGSSPKPSNVDERTFDERQGEWAIMAIVAKEGQTFARLKVKNSLCTLTYDMSVRVDWPKYKTEVEKILTPETLALWRDDLKRVETGYYATTYTHSNTGGYDPERWKHNSPSSYTHWQDRRDGGFVPVKTPQQETPTTTPPQQLAVKKCDDTDDYSPLRYAHDYGRRMEEHYKRKEAERRQDRLEMEEEWHRAEAAACGLTLEAYRLDIGWTPLEEPEKKKEETTNDPSSTGYHVV